MTFGWELIPNALTALLCFVMAAVLVYLRSDHRANQALAAALLLRGSWQTATLLGEVVEGAQADFWSSLVPYYVLPYLLALIYLVLVYPRPRGRIGRSRWTPVVLAVLGAAAAVAYGWDHSLVVGPGGEPGPLRVGWGIGNLVFPLGALALARSFVTAEESRERWSLLLMSLGLSLILAYDLLAAFGALGTSFPETSRQVLFLVDLGQATSYVVLLGYLVYERLRTTDPMVRSGFTGYLGVLAVVGLTFLAALADPGGQGTELDTFFGGFWDLALPLVVAYALLRHQLFGIDAKVRFGLSKTTVAGVFVAVFFVVSEGAQALFADFAGNELLGVLAAGLLVFAISPLQRLADRFAAKAVPGGAQADAGVEEQYRAAVEMALVDGEIDREEERRLAEKADELGIDTTRAFELREQVAEETRGRGEA